MTNWIAGGAIVGVLASSWRYVSWAFNQVSTFIVGKVILEGDASHQGIAYFRWVGRFNEYGTRHYRPKYFWVIPVAAMRMIMTEKLGDKPRVSWIGWTPFMLIHSINDDTNKSSPDTLTILFPRIAISPDDLVTRIEEVYHREIQYSLTATRYLVKREVGSGPMLARQGEPSGAQSADPGVSQNLEFLSSRPVAWYRSELHIGGVLGEQGSYLSQMALSPEARQLIREFEIWFKSRDWYRRHSIAWRRGFLLTGIPGTGKTSLANAIAHDYDLPLISLDLSTMSNVEFTQYWSGAQLQRPCIVLIEDIDGVFEGRKNILGDRGGGLTFDCLLNMISGAQSNDGICLFMTTNQPSTLDDALARYDPETEQWHLRPGRIDRVVDLGPPDEEGRRLIAGRILSDYPDHIEEVVGAGDGETGAQFEERCVRLALQLFWKEDHPSKKHSYESSSILAGTDRHPGC